MTYKIIWDEKVRQVLKKINKPDAQRIIRKVNNIADEPKYYLQMLVDINGYKLRIGDYRAIIELKENDKILIVLLVGHRSNIYKHANKMKFKFSAK